MKYLTFDLLSKSSNISTETIKTFRLFFGSDARILPSDLLLSAIGDKFDFDELAEALLEPNQLLHYKFERNSANEYFWNIERDASNIFANAPIFSDKDAWGKARARYENDIFSGILEAKRRRARAFVTSFNN